MLRCCSAWPVCKPAQRHIDGQQYWIWNIHEQFKPTDYGKYGNVGAEKFIVARDFLLQHREDYATAVRDFVWPKLTHFNWALDYFDSMAIHNTATALWIVEEDGREQKRSFQQMSQRSNQVANFFLQQGSGPAIVR